MTESSDSRGCLPLTEACNLALYRKNIFRITGLPVDASAREVARRAQKLRMQEEFGVATPGGGGAHPLTPSPGEAEIRTALARMMEPRQRLVDEFFWYWPETPGASQDDEALQAWLSGDGDRAVRLWHVREQSGSLPARHNLAVFHHMLAMDGAQVRFADRAGAGCDQELRIHWREAFARWEPLANNRDLWALLGQRVRDLDDGAVDGGFVREMQRSLPGALDRLNAEAALRFAETGHHDWARFHIDLMRRGLRGPDGFDSTAAVVLAPIRRQVEQQLAAAQAQAEAMPARSAELATQLMSQCRPMIEIFDLFHGRDSHQQAELSDSVAETALELAITHQQQERDDHAFVAVLRAALDFSSNPTLSDRIRNNIGIGEGNLAWKQFAPILNELRRVSESAVKPREKFADIKRAILPKVPEAATRVGTGTEAYGKLLDCLASGLETIALAAQEAGDFKTSEEAIELALKLAHDPAGKQQISEGRKLLSDTRRILECFYCGTHLAEPGCAHNLAMHNFLLVGTIPIPRCKICRNKHLGISLTGWAGVVALTVVGGLWADRFLSGMWMFGGGLGVCGGLLISSLIQPIMRFCCGFKRPSAHPEVRRLITAGWRIGNPPRR